MNEQFVPVMRPLLADRVAREILQRIVDARLPPGHPLPTERELCEQFGVSRTVVREATRFLLARGIVESRAGRGSVVARVNAEVVSETLGLFLREQMTDYREVHEIRELLEGKAARLAADRRQVDDLEALERVHQTMLDCAEDGDLERLSLADIEFHRTLARATGNRIFVVLLDAIAPALVTVRRTNLAQAQGRTEALNAHGHLLERVKAGDASGAAEAMARHLAYVIECWQKVGDPDPGSEPAVS